MSIFSRVPISLHANPKLKDLFSVFADDESYNSGHGQAYKEYGIDPQKGCLVILRPDQCKLFFLHLRCSRN